MYNILHSYWTYIIIAIVFIVAWIIEYDKKHPLSEEERLKLQSDYNYKHNTVLVKLNVINVKWAGLVKTNVFSIKDSFFLQHETGIVLGVGSANFKLLQDNIGQEIYAEIRAFEYYGCESSYVSSVEGASSLLSTWSIKEPSNIDKLINFIPHPKL